MVRYKSIAATFVCLVLFAAMFSFTPSEVQLKMNSGRQKESLLELQPSEWSYPLQAQQHIAFLANQNYPIGNVAEDPNVLFIDGREECHRMRGFLTKVRQSGFLGIVILLVYYAADVASCSGIVGAFMPMEVFYCDVPLYEPTLLQYHGVAKYFEANPGSIALHPKAAIVKPDDVVWCQNPFPDIPLPPASDGAPWDHALYSRPTNLTIYAVYGHQTDIDQNVNTFQDKFYLYERGESDTCEVSGTRLSGIGRVIDHFLAGPSSALLVYVKLILRHAGLRKARDGPTASFHYQDWVEEVAQYTNSHLRQLEPKGRYQPAECYYYLPSSDAHCLSCKRGTHSLIVATKQCMRNASSPVPNYTPYCKEPYRYPLMEVPGNMSLEGHAYPRMIEAARRIRAKGLFSEPPTKPLATATARCPHGLLGVVSMMTGYRIHHVGRFIGSFLSSADPHCTKLVMLVNPSDGLEAAGEMYPERVEVVSLSSTSEYEADFMKDCKASDRRFEILLKWLAKNHGRFRYVMSIDSRDYLFLSDPLAQLVKILDQGGYKEADFVSAVAEAFTTGGSSHPHFSITFFLRKWLSSCGHSCYEKIARSYFTNGEPLAVLNSGHIIGTAVGLLHYYRFHVNQLMESRHKCDGSDQGLFTYYMYGMLQEARYPHKILVLSTSRSGFTNMPVPHRLARRSQPQKDGYFPDSKPRFEFTVIDCNSNIVAGLHQYDRYKYDYAPLERTEAFMAPWKGTFSDFEHKLPAAKEEKNNKKRRRRQR